MKHIKVYEEYSDDEIRDLIGGLRTVGQSSVPLDIDYGPYHGMGEKEKEGERNIVDNWSFEIPGGEDVKVRSGSIKVSPGKITRVVLNMTNGDVLELETDNKILRTESFSINGDFPDPLQKSSWVMDDPEYTLDALTRYEHYLINKYKIGQKPPTFFQKLKKKIGLDESDYTDDELKDLMGDLHGVGHHKLDFDVKEDPDSKYPGWVEDERQAAESWTSKYNKNVFLTKVSGEMGNLDSNVDLSFSNGDKANFTMSYDSRWGSEILLTLNGKEYRISDQHYKSGPTVMKTFLDLYDSIK